LTRAAGVKPFFAYYPFEEQYSVPLSQMHYGLSKLAEDIFIDRIDSNLGAKGRVYFLFSVSDEI
jgi:hypothetical protein